MEHVGKVPSKQEDDIKISSKIKLLKKEIDKSVKNEDYESAAKFRDEIKGLIDNSNGKISD